MGKKSHRQQVKDESEDWMTRKWRPAMGWLYMFICGFDFVIAPILWSLVQAHFNGSVQSQWQPLTLQGAGLFHLAMGAVLGITAYGRTQEKLNGTAGTFSAGFGPGAGTTYMPPGSQPNQMNNGFGNGMQPNQMNNGFSNGMQSGQMNNGFGSQQNNSFGSNNTPGFPSTFPNTAAPIPSASTIHTIASPSGKPGPTAQPIL